MDIVIKLVMFVVGVLVGVFITVLFARARIRGDKDRMDIMRIASGKQDDAIRKKEARIANLEKEIRHMRRREE